VPRRRPNLDRAKAAADRVDRGRAQTASAMALSFDERSVKRDLPDLVVFLVATCCGGANPDDVSGD
jgi:hypothetical protein